MHMRYAAARDMQAIFQGATQSGTRRIAGRVVSRAHAIGDSGVNRRRGGCAAYGSFDGERHQPSAAPLLIHVHDHQEP